MADSRYHLEWLSRWSRPLRVLIFGLNYTPELTGIGKYTGEMASWLAAHGHQVRVVTSHPYYPAWRVSEAYRGKGYVVEDEGPGKPVVTRCPLYVPRQATGIRRILHLLSFAVSGVPVMLREVCRAPDLIWTVEPTFFCAPVALAAGKLACAPVWLHVQDMEVHAAFNLKLLPSRGLVHRAALAGERMFTRNFQRVSSISRRMMVRALDKGVSPELLLFFPNWADVDAVAPRPADAPNLFREQLGLAGKIVFLYSGNMGNKQGLELLLPMMNALRSHPEVHFVFCGDGTYRPALEAAVKHLPNVTLLPLQPLELLNDLLNLADIHLLPQRADAADLVMPSKLTGMFASGRPVLATAAPGTQLEWMVRGGSTHSACGMVVPPADAQALMDAAEHLVSNPEDRQRMGLTARAYAVEHLGCEQVLQQFERELNAMVLEFRQPALHPEPHAIPIAGLL